MVGVDVLMTSRKAAPRITQGLLDAAARGDRNASGALVDFVYGWVRGVLRAGPDIDDVTQEAFVAVIVATRKGQYDQHRENKQDWVLKITLRKVIDAQRRKRREEALLDDGSSLEEASGPPSVDPVSRIERQRQADRITGVLNELNETDRALLLLRFQEEMSYDEVADTLGIPLGTVKSRLSRLLQKLKLKLDPSASLSAQSPEQSPGGVNGGES